MMLLFVRSIWQGKTSLSGLKDCHESFNVFGGAGGDRTREASCLAQNTKELNRSVRPCSSASDTGPTPAAVAAMASLIETGEGLVG